MKPSPHELRIVEVTATAQGRKVMLSYRVDQTDGITARKRITTRMVRMHLALPPTDDELTRLAGTMANFVIQPQNRHIRAPKALVWREIPMGNDVTHDHGRQVDDRQMPMDPLPLFDGSTDAPDGSTITTGLAPLGAAGAKRPPSSAREPRIRNLRTGKQSTVDGS